MPRARGREGRGRPRRREEGPRRSKRKGAEGRGAVSLEACVVAVSEGGASLCGGGRGRRRPLPRCPRPQGSSTYASTRTDRPDFAGFPGPGPRDSLNPRAHPKLGRWSLGVGPPSLCTSRAPGPPTLVFALGMTLGPRGVAGQRKGALGGDPSPAGVARQRVPKGREGPLDGSGVGWEARAARRRGGGQTINVEGV